MSIRNWQSLRAVDLTLGRLTVIVGPSSSGKSALMRAFRAIASNATGAHAVTRGATAAAITVRTDTGSVTLEYARGAWRYRLVDGKREAEYTKLNRSVPEAVTDALRINPVPTGGTSLNFASQFDKPYLLTDSGSLVARQLGELTNVDTVYSAVREANRRKATTAATLKTRTADLERVTADQASFNGLEQRIGFCDRAERRAEFAQQLVATTSRLTAAIDTLEIAENVLARTADLPDLPDITATDQANARLADFRDLVRESARADAEVRRREQDVAAAIEQETALADEHQRILVTLGSCPTCGQTITP